MATQQQQQQRCYGNCSQTVGGESGRPGVAGGRWAHTQPQHLRRGPSPRRLGPPAAQVCSVSSQLLQVGTAGSFGLLSLLFLSHGGPLKLMRVGGGYQQGGVIGGNEQSSDEEKARHTCTGKATITVSDHQTACLAPPLQPQHLQAQASLPSEAPACTHCRLSPPRHPGPLPHRQPCCHCSKPPPSNSKCIKVLGGQSQTAYPAGESTMSLGCWNRGAILKIRHGQARMEKTRI